MAASFIATASALVVNVFGGRKPTPQGIVFTGQYRKQQKVVGNGRAYWELHVPDVA